MSINRIQKLLFSEYCDFQDMVLVESPFAETTRDGRGLRQVHLGLTPSKLVLATDILPLATDATFWYAPGTDPDTETFELIAVYPIECVSLSIFRRSKRQTLKARFCNNKIFYFELGGFEKRNMFWNLWCEKVKFLNPENPNSSHSETSVATSTTNSTLYLVSSKRFNSDGNSQIWFKYGSGDFNRLNPATWTDKYLYLGKTMEESPMTYAPGQQSLGIAEFVKRKEIPLRNEYHINSETNATLTYTALTPINRFSNGIKENCTSKLFLPMDEDVLLNKKYSDTTSQSLNLEFKSLQSATEIAEIAENAVRLWEFYKVSSTSMSTRSRHRRRFAIAPQSHFLHGLGPWSVNSGERYSLQMKRAISVVAIKRQPPDPELRLSVSRRQLIASISYEALYSSEKMIRFNNNTLRIPPKRPVIFFWTPEYWYRPRSARDAYQELQKHLKKIRQYHQLRESFRSKLYRRFNNQGKGSQSSSDECVEYPLKQRRRKSKTVVGRLARRVLDFSDKGLAIIEHHLLISNLVLFRPCRYFKETDRAPKENSLRFLKRMLKLNVALTAWDFDSNTLAFQLTLIDKELFLKVTPAELGILVWQQSSKNAPNVGALIAFSHRISCLVATEILKDDSEKIRARLVARFINAADKCNKISNFQSCRSVLSGLQSPSVYRLHSVWTYVRRKHSSKYQTFEKLCRLYRDPRLCIYQRTFTYASRTPPYLPYIGDLLGRLLDRTPDYGASMKYLGIKVRVKQNINEIARQDTKSPSLFKKILSTLRVRTSDVKPTPDPIFNQNRTYVEKPPKKKWKNLCDLYKPLDVYEDNRQARLSECVQLLEVYQKAAANYLYAKNELAREYLLKARYREDKENFIYSFNIEPPSHY